VRRKGAPEGKGGNRVDDLPDFPYIEKKPFLFLKCEKRRVDWVPLFFGAWGSFFPGA
jgi:hypothetical protein